MSPSLTHRLLALAATASLLGSLPAHAGLTATVSTDIPAARAAFLSQATVLGAYDWSSLWPAGTHSFGIRGAVANRADLSFTASDGAINWAHTTNTDGFGLSLAPSNWVDGPGFDSPDGLHAAADLALNGSESFDLAFGSPYRSVGLAIATGQSNLPSEVDLRGASFDFTALDANGAAIGTASLNLPGGAPASAWVTLVASAPIHRLQVRETVVPGGTANDIINDQYFSNIYATPATVSAVPEPGTWLLMGLGLAGLGLLRQQRTATRRS
jgi:hypothetical protein